MKIAASSLQLLAAMTCACSGAPHDHGTLEEDAGSMAWDSGVSGTSDAGREANEQTDAAPPPKQAGPDAGGASNSDAGEAVALGPAAMLECGDVEDIMGLLPGQWCNLAGSRLSDVVPTGDALEAVRGNSGPAAIMGAWGGAAFDTTRDQLLVWGGGHMDYAGNEVYAFNLHTSTWSRLSEPSTDVGGDEPSGLYPDGLPRARHTYNYLQYVATPFDAMCSFGGAAFYPSGQTGNGAVVCFHLANTHWSTEGELDHGGNIGAISAIDPTTGHIWSHGTGNEAYLSDYDPHSGQATRHVRFDEGFFGYELTAAIEPDARKLVGVGGGRVRIWDLENPEADSVVIETTGGDALVNANNPGFDYDSATKQLIGWAEGGSVYALDLEARSWSEKQLRDDVTPTSPSPNGTYGRFRYVPSLDIFVLVNGIDEDVQLYRLSQ